MKRNGKKEPVFFDKITARLEKLNWGLEETVDVTVITQKVISGLYSGVTTSKLDELAAQTAAHMVTVHPDYGVLAGRIAVSNLQKETNNVFSEVMAELYAYVNPKTGLHAPLISKELNDFIQANKERLNASILDQRDFDYDYFGIMTLLRGYMHQVNGKHAERPQHMLMRVSLAIHMPNIEAGLETYDLMSRKICTHATPTLFNAGRPVGQLSSCFLLTMQADSIEGIYGTLAQCAQISKHAGGIGVSVSNIRATGSYINGSGGNSNGLVPMLRVFNETARYVDQGGGKRKGAFAIYLEPWHADVFQFLDLKKNHGKEEQRARDLFYALWVPDLLMQRVKENKLWSLMCPSECPGLMDVCGDMFKEMYESYEARGKFRKQIPARDLFFKIIDSQIETGTPYMLYKDSCNFKSNQKHLGVIRGSNLCTEIIEFTSADEVAVCNLASIALPKFVSEDRKTYDFEALANVVRVLTRNLNKVIDVNYYPLPEAKRSNLRHRPIALGVQGLADAFQMLRFPFDSDEARKLNIQIFETMYYAAVDASADLAGIEGVYETYEGSPTSKGQLQYDLWGVTPSDLWPWEKLKEKVAKNGLRNSLLVGPMPTASTSQILGNNECFEPYTSNLYVRRTLAGEFVVINKHLMRDLLDRNLWNPLMKDRIIQQNGSIQKIKEIPQDLKDLYKTVWEIKQRQIIQMAADRGPFIDQSQSLNLHLQDPTRKKMSAMHMFAWSQGLKTGMYYLRSKAATDAIKFTVNQARLEESEGAVGAGAEEDCLMCGS